MNWIKRHTFWATAILIFIGFGIGAGATFIYERNSKTDEANLPALFNVDEGVKANLRFVDHTGKSVQWSDFNGSKRLVYFGYTYCPDVCPTELAEVASVVTKLQDRNVDIVPLFITLDPVRDDLAVLRDYVPYFHKRLTGLRADEQSLEDIKSAFKVYSAKTKGFESDPGYLIDHTSAIFFVSEDGGVRNIFEGNATVDEMVGSIL